MRFDTVNITVQWGILTVYKCCINWAVSIIHEERPEFESHLIHVQILQLILSRPKLAYCSFLNLGILG